jgi:predicted ArsR family transcriptional regulator
MPNPRPSVRLADPRALRAYAHPVRLQLMGLLRQRGPQTATQAAQVIGESVPSCSFHLRQLAKYGLVEPAEGGRGREKPWQATAMATAWEAEPGGPDAEAALSLELAMARQYFDLVAHWLTSRASAPAEWRAAARAGDSLLQLTAAELSRLNEQIDELVEPFRAKTAGARPEGTRPVVMLHLVIPADEEAS